MDDMEVQTNANAIALVVAAILCPMQLADAQQKAHLKALEQCRCSVRHKCKD